MNSSYYINQIETKLKHLGLDIDKDFEYNMIYDTESDAEFNRLLRQYNEKLNKLIDEMKKDDDDSGYYGPV